MKATDIKVLQLNDNAVGFSIVRFKVNKTEDFRFLGKIILLKFDFYFMKTYSFFKKS